VARRAARRGAHVPEARRRGEMISSWKCFVCITFDREVIAVYGLVGESSC
jgi:hypothetical protein